MKIHTTKHYVASDGSTMMKYACSKKIKPRFYQFSSLINNEDKYMEKTMLKLRDTVNKI